MAELPQVFVFDSGSEDDAAQSLGAWLEGLGVESPFVLSSVHGKTLASRLPGPHHASPDRAADQRAASDLGSEAQRSGADAIVAIGGGRCLDVGKLAAARAGLTVLAVPTQLSHDGICSPVAVVPGDSGVSESLGAIAPRAVFISVPTLLQAPLASVRAGLGDLLANPLALRDWALAAEHGLEEIDRRAWELSTESFELIEPHLDSDPAALAEDAAFVRRLSDALVLSGMAMIRAGTSRPASGAEHEISHAIDGGLGGRGMHGAQVAFGCIFSVALYGEDTAGFRRRLARLGLPQRPSDLGLDEDDAVKLLLEAPDTRPGRFTVLEDADLDEGAARRLVERIWND